MQPIARKVYKLQNEENVYLTEDINGCISGGSGNEPAWSFRLWHAAVVLSKFVEVVALDKIAMSDVVDLGYRSMLFVSLTLLILNMLV